MKRIDCFIPCPDGGQAARTVESLSREAEINRIVRLAAPLGETATLRRIAAESEAPYTLIRDGLCRPFQRGGRHPAGGARH